MAARLTLPTVLPSAASVLVTRDRGYLLRVSREHLDAALFRNFPIREKMGLEFRAEAFSVTNTPHFSNPQTLLTSPSFGYIKGTGDQNGAGTVGDGNRVLELSGKFYF